LRRIGAAGVEDAAEVLAQPEIRVGAEDLGAAVQLPAEGRLRLVEAEAHLQVMVPEAREEERHRTLRPGAAPPGGAGAEPALRTALAQRPHGAVRALGPCADHRPPL